MTTTKVIGHALIDNKPVLLYAAVTDGTAAELTARDLAGTLVNLKDTYRGQVISYLEVDVGTPSDLDLIQAKEGSGAILYEFGGSINAALGHCPRMVAEDINIRIDEGFALEVTTSD